MRTLLGSHGPSLALLLFAVVGCQPVNQPGAEPGPAPSPVLSTATGQLPFDAAVLHSPRQDEGLEIDRYLAPLIYMESVANGDPGAGPQLGGLGVPRLSDDAQRIELDSRTPVVFFEEGELSGKGAAHRQLTFVWFREGADAQVLAQGVRTTFAADSYPAILEVLHDRSGVRAVYVTESEEASCLERHGAPLDGLRHAVEAPPVEGRRLVEVIGTGAMPMGPFVYQAANSSDVPTLHCRCSPSRVTDVLDTVEYELRQLASLGEVLALVDVSFGAPEAALEGLRLPADF